MSMRVLAIILFVCALLGGSPARGQDAVATALEQVRAEIAAERAAFAREQAEIDQARQPMRQQIAAAARARAAADAETATALAEQARLSATFRRRRSGPPPAVMQRSQTLAALHRSVDSRYAAARKQVEALGPPTRHRGSLPPAPPEARSLEDRLAYVLWADHLLLADAGAVVQDGMAIEPTGDQRNQANLRIGWIAGFANLSDGRAGLLRFERGQFAPLIEPYPESVDWPTMSDDSDSGRRFLVPIDLTGGEAVALLAAEQTWQEQLMAGGPVVWPLLAIAALALLMVLERTMTYARLRARESRLEHDMPPLLAAGDLAAAEARIADQDGPITRVWRRGLALVRQPHDAGEEAMQEAVLAEVPAIERFLSTLAVFAAVAPLLGLLGTVSGMIKTFQAISLEGAANAQGLSGGISEALVTTWLGLLVAIPILLAHAALVRQARLIVGRLDQAALLALSAIGQDPNAAPKPDSGEADR